jgi:nucleoside-diphosphate-sugar epimerase
MTHDPEDTLVTVTGASGFIALHCVRELLVRGYQVRGTLRDLGRQGAIRAALADADSSRLSFVKAELTQDDGWSEAMAGAKYVMHVASPLPKAPPKHEDELLVPAREGVLRALRAAAAAGVSRVVMTSSLAAISSGRERGESSGIGRS